MKNTLTGFAFALMIFVGMAFYAPSSAPETAAASARIHSYVSIVEIPANDLSRAVSFYQEVLGIKIEKMEFPGMEMGLFPYEEEMVTAVIMKGEGYEPSAKGATIYLNAGSDLQSALDKVKQNGGKILVPKTPHADESGFFALFLDSEGNKLGLHSTN